MLATCRRGFASNRAIFASFALLTCAVPCLAQYNSLLGNFDDPGSAFIATIISNQILAQPARKAISGDPAPTAYRLTFFRAHGDWTAKELAGKFAADPATRARLTAEFMQSLKTFDEQMRAANEPADDLAQAAGYYVISNYYAATGRMPNDAQSRDAKAQLRIRMGQSRELASKSDPSRQRLFETLVILGAVSAERTLQSVQSGQADKRQWFREFGRKNLAEFGLPIERMQLTENGFRLE